MVALFCGSFRMFKTKYRIVESHGWYRPEYKMWWWPFWITILYTYSTLDEPKRFLNILRSYEGGKVVEEWL